MSIPLCQPLMIHIMSPLHTPLLWNMLTSWMTTFARNSAGFQWSLTGDI